MADTDTETLPNGTGALSEEDERLKQRPADIDADVREMERRKRVEALMSSKLFREELERVLDQQMNEGNDGSLLQRIREMVGGRMHTGSMRGPSCVLPINDIRGIEGVGYEKGEKILRCKLAAVYRLVDLFGWTQTGLTGQITARLNTAVEQVLTSPRGLLPHEVTASSLVKVDMQGNLVDQGTTNFPVNTDGIAVHLSVHAARPDIRCVVHVRSASALAVSATRRGLQPVSEEAALLGPVAYHQLPYGPLDDEERDKLVRALGPRSLVLFLRSSGALCCGATLEEAFYHAKNLAAACDVQLRLNGLPEDEIQPHSEDVRRQIYEASRKAPTDSSKWRVGGEEFEALMRMLDNAGFRTGYIYRHPLIKNDVPKPKNDVEVPPAVSSLGYLLEEEEMYRQGLWRKGHGKTGERSRWLNSPNVYQKVEVLETGTSDPKKITKWVDANNDEWVQDGSPNSSTPVKINTLQFVPKNTNPKEFKALQQQIKENRRADKISAGPQSHILEGVTWDEASKLVGEDAANTHTGDHVVLMGAASKGIIQRGYQHNATMYSAPYARNPFDHVTDNEIDEYTRIVNRKQRGEYDTDLSECEGVSAAQITSPATETEDESRDEHRVLRIETKQVPVRSQPEVVLSDVDTTDFLNAERVHAERTRDRDPNLLSDDEVFLDSAASTTSELMSAPMSDVGSPTSFTVRAHQSAVRQSVRQSVRGTKIAQDLQNEVFSTNKRSKHDYSRVNTFESVSKKYNSPESSHSDSKTLHPKCKVSLNARLDVNYEAIDVNVGNFSSRSSLYSIPSIEWDGRCKSEYAFRSQSLPRQKSKHTGKLYRTRSHSGFINSHIKDPEPCHFHIPRCRSCGNTNYSYSFNVKEDKCKKMPSSFYLSVDSIPQKCYEEEFNIIKIREKLVPVYKAQSEFVETQEFTEDNYICDIGNSFSSDNQTVIEKVVKDNEDHKINDGEKLQEIHDKNDEESKVYKAEPLEIVTDDSFLNDSISTVNEGEYHSFTEENIVYEEIYESPLKDLVIKDIRDYSVPIEYYCDDFGKKSPLKKRDVKANVLEPILEESKSSYGDDSGNASSFDRDSGKDNKCVIKVTTICADKHKNDYVGVKTVETVLVNCNNEQNIMKDDEQVTKIFDDKKYIINDKKGNSNDINVQAKFMDGGGDISNDNMAIKSFVIDVVTRAESVIELKQEIIHAHPEKVTKQILEHTTEIHAKTDTYFVSEEDSDVTTNDVEIISLSAVQTAMDLYSEDEECDVDQKKILNCVYENVFEILSTDAISFENVDVTKGVEVSEGSSVEAKSFDSTAEFEKYEVVADLLMTLLNRLDLQQTCSDLFVNLPKKNQKCLHFETISDDNFEINEDVSISNDTSVEVKPDISMSVTTNGAEGDSNFSITKIIENIEQNINLNETILTENSDTDLNFSYKIVESVLYYIINKVYTLIDSKNKANKPKKPKRVVTVVDHEDILFTAASLWPNDGNDRGLAKHIEIRKNRNALSITTREDIVFLNIEDRTALKSTLETVKEIETCLQDDDDIIAKMKSGIISKPSIETILDSEQIEIENFDIKFEATHNLSHKNSSYDNDAELRLIEFAETAKESLEVVHEKCLEDLTGFEQSSLSDDVLSINVNRKLPDVTIHEQSILDKSVIKAKEDASGDTQEVDEKDNDKPKSSKSNESTTPSTSKDPKDVKAASSLPNTSKSTTSTTSTKTLKSKSNLKQTSDRSQLKMGSSTSSSSTKKVKAKSNTRISLDDDLSNFSEIAILKPSKAKTDLLGGLNKPSSSNVRSDNEKPSTSKSQPEQCSNLRQITESDLNQIPTYGSVNELHTLQYDRSTNEDCTVHTLQYDRSNNEDCTSNRDEDCNLCEETNDSNAGNTPLSTSKSQPEQCSNIRRITQFDLDQMCTIESVDELHTLQYDRSTNEDCTGNRDEDCNLCEETNDYNEGNTTCDFNTHPSLEQLEADNTDNLNELGSFDSNNNDSFNTQFNDDSSFNIVTKKPNDFGGSNITYTVTGVGKTVYEKENISQNETEDKHLDYTNDDSNVLNTQNTAFIVEDVLKEVYYNDFDETHRVNDESGNLEDDTSKEDSKNREDAKGNLNNTFDMEDMNTAFVGDIGNYYSRSSSPKNTSAFESCCESPIKKPSDHFIGDDLSVLYEKNTLLGSPFVKRASVIAMSQNEHAGGIKYWVSFDESLTESLISDEVRRSKTPRQLENKVPSFLTVDFSETKQKRDDFWDLIEKECYKRSSVLLDDFESTNIQEDSYFTASQSYKTCEDEFGDSKTEQKLLYDTRLDLHTWKSGRRCNSWPPFEDTLFYRIISRFRMSESFDPSDFDSFLIDSSL